MKNWSFCKNQNHEYSEYHSRECGRTVCYTCDPMSDNNAHRPCVSGWVKRGCPKEFPEPLDQVEG